MTIPTFIPSIRRLHGRYRAHTMTLRSLRPPRALCETNDNPRTLCPTVYVRRWALYSLTATTLPRKAVKSNSRIVSSDKT